MISIRQFAASAVLGTAVLVAGGCASGERAEGVPMTAQELGAGREVATFNATEPGTVYIADDTRKEMVYSGRVKEGDYIRVDAKENKVLVNSMPVTERDLLNDHKYKIYFEPSADPDARATMTTDPEAQPAGTIIQTDPNARTTVTTDPNAPVQQPQQQQYQQPPAQQERTTITTDPEEGSTTIQREPVVPPPPQSNTTITQPDGQQTTITTDPQSGQTTIRQE